MPKSVMVHEKALCESEHVGDGTRIWAFAHIMEAAVIGQNCNIGECCFIESGATLGNNVTVKNGVSIWQGVTCEDDVFFGPSCVLTNDLNPRAAIKKDGDELLVTIIRKGTTIGANATILCDLTIGTHAFIGAGAVVISDVPDHGLMVGNPAKLIGYMCTCGRQIDLDTMTCACGMKYRYLEESKVAGLNTFGVSVAD